MIYNPYTSHGGVPGSSSGPSAGAGSPYPSSNLMLSFLSRLPYAYQILDRLFQSNPKYSFFRKQSHTREQMIADQSLFLQTNADQQSGTQLGNIVLNKDYQAFVYAPIDKDKQKRLLDYRRMAAFAELSDCLDEICDECLVKDDNGNFINLILKGNLSREIHNTLQKEFKKYVELFDLEQTGWEKFRQLLIDGELFFENIVEENHPQYGVIGLVNIPSELINPVYQNIQNEIISGYILRKPITESIPSLNVQDQEQIIPLHKNQIVYIHSGIWNEFKTFRLPFIENAKRAYRQLSLIEDSVVIYKLVRAPERLVFKIFTGNMPPPKAEAYVNRLMQRLWTSKTFNRQENRAVNVYDPQSMLDAFWFTKDSQGNGSDVTTLQSGSQTGELKELEYFLTKLYKSLKVPVTRMMVPNDPFKNGLEITREELRFARFVMRIQHQFAMGIKEGFITHLKIKGLWKEFKLKEYFIKIQFNEPTSFMAMRNQQLLALKFENYNSATQNENISKSFAQKRYLKWTYEEMHENREWLRRDAALEWELQQIKANGPNFREQMMAQQGVSFDDGSTKNTSSNIPIEDIPEFGNLTPSSTPNEMQPEPDTKEQFQDTTSSAPPPPPVQPEGPTPVAT